MRPISLVFTTGDDAFQQFIRIGTWSATSHVGIGLGNWILHADDAGVVLEPKDFLFRQQQQRRVAEYSIIPNVRGGLDEALTHIGKRYDYPGVVRVGFLRLLKLLGSPLHRSLGSVPDDAHVCSAFVMLLDREGQRIPEWRGMNRAGCTPADLLGVAETGPSFLRIG